MQVRVDSWAWVKKSDLTVEQILALRKKLTLIPKKFQLNPGDEDEGSAPIHLFRDTPEEFGVPRQYYLANKRPNHTTLLRVSNGAPWPSPLEFNASLRPEQQRALDVVRTGFYGDAFGGLIKAAPGWGKTILGCSVIAALKVPTLVLVHKEFLMNQWRESLLKFLPGVRVGTIQQDELDYRGKHVVLGMIHTLAKRDMLALENHFGLIVTDEVHHISAVTYLPVITKFTARYRLGLSATPKRKDKTEAAFHYHIGDVVFETSERRLGFKVRRVYTNFQLSKAPVSYTSNAAKTQILPFLCANEGRNTAIIQNLIEAVRAGRKIIVLSERLEHLETLQRMLHKMWVLNYGPYPLVGYYVGGMKAKDREVSEGCQVILATNQFASEGLNIPALDTLIFTTPVVEVEQSSGRILRPHPGKKDPVIVDFIDTLVPLFKNMARKRDVQYTAMLGGTRT